jgi:hypothetical protein
MWIGPDMFFVCRLAWLRDGRLAWDGWTENEINVSSRTYVEGQVVDDESILDELGVSGSRVLKKLMLEHDFDTTKAEEPWLVRDNDQKTVRVSYRGQLGPEFHEVTSGPFLSEDRQRCAYAGVRYAKWARRSQYLVERIGESQMHSGLLGLVFGWPAWLLFNRDFGAGHAASESSKRYHPVCGEREWTKSYLHANVDFFTSEGSLVVTASDKDGWHVVIDEDEGPAFDHVQNVLRIPGGGVCYLAVRDDKILRVVVK